MRIPIITLVLLLAVINAFSQATELQKKAWSGDTDAMTELAQAYRFGVKVEKHEDSASFYLNKAAAHGNAGAQFLKGIELTANIFSATKYAEGIKWLEKAAASNHVEALNTLAGIWSEKGTGGQSDKYYSQTKSYGYSEKAALLNDKEALLFCAEARLKGAGTTRNDSIAVEYFKKSAIDLKYLPAKIRLGDMYFLGKVTGTREPFIALEMYRDVIKSNYSNIDQRTKADKGVHDVDQFLKTVQTINFHAGGVLLPGTFQYNLRD